MRRGKCRQCELLQGRRRVGASMRAAWLRQPRRACRDHSGSHCLLRQAALLKQSPWGRLRRSSRRCSTARSWCPACCRCHCWSRSCCRAALRCTSPWPSLPGTQPAHITGGSGAAARAGCRSAAWGSGGGRGSIGGSRGARRVARRLGELQQRRVRQQRVLAHLRIALQAQAAQQGLHFRLGHLLACTGGQQGGG